jgi:hypothetical protein
MKTTIRKTLFIAACLAANTGCDSKPAEPAEPAEPVAEAAPAAAPPPPLTTAEIVAKLDQGQLCKLFQFAISTPEKKIAGAGCSITAGASDAVITTGDGAVSLTTPVVHDGSTITVAAPIASSVAVEDKTRGGWDNIGMLFIGEAPPAKDLCMSIDYFAPNGGSNSLFVTILGSPAAAFSLVARETEWMKGKYAEPVLKAGTSGAFALTRRELGTLVKTVSFAACP